MDSFEDKLKGLRPAKPSPGLRRRIFDRPARRIVLASLVARPVGLGWAAVFVLLVGVVGFSLGRHYGRTSADATASHASVEVRILEAATSQHSFDLTAMPAEFLSGDVSVEVEAQQEI
jgi:hypothetical protein